MIIKIIDWDKNEILNIECEKCKYPTSVHDGGRGNYLQIEYWKNNNDETPFIIHVFTPFTLFLMENGKTVDSLQYCEGYDKIAKE